MRKFVLVLNVAKKPIISKNISNKKCAELNSHEKLNERNCFTTPRNGASGFQKCAVFEI